MSQNDFYVALQGILLEAQEQGWTIPRIYTEACEAVEEWFEEVGSEEVGV